MQKMGREGPKWGREFFSSPANPDLADILGNMDFDFENLYFLFFLDPKFPDFQTGAWAGLGLAGLGLGWAGLGPGWAGMGPCALA